MPRLLYQTRKKNPLVHVYKGLTVHSCLLNFATDAHMPNSMDILTLYKFTITITSYSIKKNPLVYKGLTFHSCLLNVATDAHMPNSMDILTLYKFTITITPYSIYVLQCSVHGLKSDNCWIILFSDFILPMCQWVL